MPSANTVAHTGSQARITFRTTALSLSESGMRMRVTVLVTRAAAFFFHCNRMELAVPHAFLRHHRCREMPYLFSGAAQDHGFEAVVMVEMSMHRGYGEIVVLVMHVGEATRELPLVMVVDVAERTDAVR